MAHWAELDDNDVVLRVVRYDAERDNNGGELDDVPAALLATYGGRWRRTWYDSPGHTYAGPGSTWDAGTGNFVAPQPFPSWALDGDQVWQPPVPSPDDLGIAYDWNETLRAWVPRPT